MASSAAATAAMVEDSSFEDDQIASMSSDDILRASRLLDNEIRILRVCIMITTTNLSNLYMDLVSRVSIFLLLSFCSFGLVGGVSENEPGVGVIQGED